MTIKREIDEPRPHDDATLLIYQFGTADIDDSNESDALEMSLTGSPAPGLSTRSLVYSAERVYAGYLGDQIFGGSAPRTWTWLGFKDPSSDVILEPAEALGRLEPRRVRVCPPDTQTWWTIRVPWTTLRDARRREKKGRA